MSYSNPLPCSHMLDLLHGSPFLSQRCEIFIPWSVRVYEYDPTIFDDFRKLPRTFWRISKFWSFTIHLGSTEDEQNAVLFSFKIGEPGRKAWFIWTILFSNWIKFSFFCAKMGHLKITSSHLWVRCEKLVCRCDLALEQSFRLTGMRLLPEAWELVGIQSLSSTQQM